MVLNKQQYKQGPLYLKGHTVPANMDEGNVRMERDHIKVSLKAMHCT
jgi:hypothetical protein